MTETLSQGIDYLGFFDAKLRDLKGYTILAQELIQNADDAGARTMTFDVCDDALVVTNDSFFSDCNRVRDDECPWKKDPSKGHRCDFHRFRIVAGGDKRTQDFTTGAFGIGFISVYQITDHPEIQSGRWRWIIRPEMPENQRIEIHEQSITAHTGTRFTLPWAANPTSELRLRLKIEHVQADKAIPEIIKELSQNLPDAILFLKNVLSMDLKHNGKLIKTVKRIPKGDQIDIHDGNAVRRWRIFTGKFDATLLLSQYKTQIEAKRKPHVSIALLEAEGNIKGRFYACLPTQQSTALPFHINADFYPSTDRKSICFTDDYQGDWNRAAISKAAELVAASIQSLPRYLSHTQLWNLFKHLKDVHDQAEKGEHDPILQTFWIKALPCIQRFATVYTSTHRWEQPANTRLLENKADPSYIRLLERLGLTIVEPELRNVYSLLREVGVPLFGLSDLAQALQRSGLERPILLTNAPAWIHPADTRELLGREIASLREQQIKSDERERARQAISSCAIALSRDGHLRSPASLYRANPNLIPTLSALGFDKQLADQNPTGIADLIPELDVSATLCLLETITTEKFEWLWQEQHALHIALISWFDQYHSLFERDHNLKKRVQTLRIWPSGQKVYPLNELFVVNSFEDPLDIALIIVREIRRENHRLLRALGNRWLKLETYASESIPKAFKSGRKITPDQCRQLVSILAEKIGELQGNDQVRKALASCPLVECRDGQFRSATSVYFDDVIAAGFSDLSVAALPENRLEATRSFYKWIGVVSEPRLSDIVKRIQITVTLPHTPETRKTITQIFRHLSSRQLDASDPHRVTLRTLCWLPAINDASKWYSPNQIYATSQSRLFESQAQFLDLPLQIQTREMLQFLDIKTNPEPIQVIRHLLFCADQKIEVHADVYRFLNEDKTNNPDIPALRNKRCLYFGNGDYVAPDHVFRSNHSFGRFRDRLPSELLAYQKLLDQLKIPNSPHTEDSINVIQDIATAFVGIPLDDEAYKVLMTCWHLLDEAIQASKLHSLPELLRIPCIPTEDRYLRPPTEIFFADRSGLAERFGDFKRQHTIPRISGIWRAMAAAGVEPLSKEAQTHLKTCADTLHAVDLHDHILTRSALLARVIDAQLDHDQSWNKDVLSRLHVASVSQLELVYEIKIPGRPLQRSNPTTEIAYFDSDNTILYVQTLPNQPWRTIARELAYALLPEDESASLAPAFHEVLSASTSEDAIVALNELGIAQLDIADFTSLKVSPTDDIEPLDEEYDGVPTETGTSEDDTDYDEESEDDEEENTPDRDITPIRPHMEHPLPGTGQTPFPNGASHPTPHIGSGVPATNGASNTTPFTNGHSASNGASNGKTPFNNSGNPSSPGASSHPAPGGSTSQPSSAPKRAAGNRLLSYVAPAKDPKEPSDSDPSDHAANSAVDQAGVARVLQFEHDAGRFPTEMPHGNHGYDIEARDITGEFVVRYIEVKSIAGYWNATGVGLSKEQFSRAHVHQDQFWLYVVERAEHDDARIYCIQDPARRVDKFFYDSGWRALAEQIEHNTESVTTSEES